MTVSSTAAITGPLSNTASTTALVAGTPRLLASASGSVLSVSATADSDGDGVANSADCQPFDGATWAAPGEARSLVLTTAAGGTLAWQPPSAPGGTALVYDVLASTSPSSFAGAACLATGVSGTSATDPSIPDELVCYLVRSRNACGGELGTSSDGTPHSGPNCP